MIQSRFFNVAARVNAEILIDLALAEDLGLEIPHPSQGEDAGRNFHGTRARSADLTSEATIPANARGAARFVARAGGTAAGLPVVEMIARHCGVASFEPMVDDGQSFAPRTVLAEVAGSLRDLLIMERTALNFVQRLSGIATLTTLFVGAVTGTKAVIMDTRKTTPGWRALEKYAVRCGGGTNHRFGLYDAVLVKDNHLAWLGCLGEGDPVGTAVATARERTAPGVALEVEVDSLDQLDRALECNPDIVLLDNFGPDALEEAVRRRDAAAPRVLLEASGGVNLNTVRAIAQTGVDRVSVGALTHSAPALDIGLDFDRSQPT